ncbi:MAG: NUDIX hydrolase [Nannocystaceae bacterium]|nr:NUDIX hydrolase [bacterium]
MPPEGHSVRVVVIVLVRRGYRYLMVRDDNRGGTWFPPAGAVEHGEDVLTAAERIVQRASGCTPVLEGVVRVSHMPLLPGSRTGRLRFVLEARLSTDALSEKTATMPASYLLPNEVGALDLRDASIATLITEHARGMPTAPLELYRVGLA